jgi:hypothetical protein
MERNEIARRRFTAKQTIAILRRHLLQTAPVSTLCDRRPINPAIFCRWQKEPFENAAAAFAKPPAPVPRPGTSVRANDSNTSCAHVKRPRPSSCKERAALKSG